jgi:hypothetical protein
LPFTLAILHGFSEWIFPSHHSRAHIVGSLFPANILLTSAFYDQYHNIGCFQACLGRLSVNGNRQYSYMILL